MPTTRKKIGFIGSDGITLSGLLELPTAQPIATILFAHCFTCGKDIAAASRISRALAANGFAVMRFDFTGLGGSDGDFSNTNFSSNIDDLIAAATYLKETLLAPAILIGHSLGGTAVLRAAHQIPECKGVVTIGSPADADHIVKQFSGDLDKINSDGEAVVSLAGRDFKIKKQFLDDVEKHPNCDIGSLKKALLIFHSPTDTTVSIKQAEKIYQRAKHPKSFISLDNADHLLSKKHDADYVANTISAWASRFVAENPVSRSEQTGIEKGKLMVEERNHQFTQNVISDHHVWLADEPIEVGGANLGPDPYEHLLASLGSCTAMTIRMYANRKEWPVDDVKVELSHSRQHGEDCQQCDSDHAQIALISRTINIKGDISEEQRQRLLEIADRCPVHKTLHGKIVVGTKISE